MFSHFCTTSCPFKSHFLQLCTFLLTIPLYLSYWSIALWVAVKWLQFYNPCSNISLFQNVLYSFSWKIDILSPFLIDQNNLSVSGQLQRLMWCTWFGCFSVHIKFHKALQQKVAWVFKYLRILNSFIIIPSSQGHFCLSYRMQNKLLKTALNAAGLSLQIIPLCIDKYSVKFYPAVPVFKIHLDISISSWISSLRISQCPFLFMATTINFFSSLPLSWGHKAKFFHNETVRLNHRKFASLLHTNEIRKVAVHNSKLLPKEQTYAES